MIKPNLQVLERLTPAVRTSLVRERIRAMRGHLEESLLNLERLCTQTQRDVVAVALLKAELLHLNREDSRAVEVLRESVTPHLETLDAIEQLVVDDNLADAQLALDPAESSKLFYSAVDRRRLMGVQWSDGWTAAAAYESIDSGKPQHAISKLGKELIHCFGSGCWREIRRAAAVYGAACIKVNAIDEAFFYSLLAGTDHLVDRITSAVTIRREPAVTAGLIRRAISHANLRVHFVVACQTFAKISDLIPDELLQEFTTWLLPRCKETRDELIGTSAMRAAWEALAPIAMRLPANIAETVLNCTIEHPVWRAPLPEGNRVLVDRVRLIDAADNLIEALPVPQIDLLVDAALPLAVDRVQSSDYVETINLLCHAAEKGGDAIKQKIATALYQPGKPLTRVLVSVASFFGKTAFSGDQLSRFADRVIEEIDLQVQVVRPGEKPKEVPETLMTFNEGTPEGERKITTGSTHGLASVIKHRSELSDESVSRLIRSMLRMTMSEDNLPANREVLVRHLIDLTDVIRGDLRSQVFSSIKPLASGCFHLHETEGSLRSQFGSKENIQAIALVCLAEIFGSDSSTAAEVQGILDEALTDQRPVVRRGAYAAARRMPGLSDQSIAAVIMGTRDPDPAAASTAFAAISARLEWQLVGPLWRLFLLAVQLASHSPDVRLRREAAVSLVRRLSKAPEPALQLQASELVNAFATDVAASVRASVKYGSSDAP